MKNLKMLFLAVILCGTYMVSNAQVELKINPIGTLFGDPDLSGEFIISENFGIEPTFILTTGNAKLFGEGLRKTGFGGAVAGKYYFNPKKGGDGFHAGLYTKFKNTMYTTRDGEISENIEDDVEASQQRLAVGIQAGFKTVSDNNLVFEIIGGLGRNINNKITGFDETVGVSALPFANIDPTFRISLGYRFGGGSGLDR